MKWKAYETPFETNEEALKVLEEGDGLYSLKVRPEEEPEEGQTEADQKHPWWFMVAGGNYVNLNGDFTREQLLAILHFHPEVQKELNENKVVPVQVSRFPESLEQPEVTAAYFSFAATVEKCVVKFQVNDKQLRLDLKFTNRESIDIFERAVNTWIRAVGSRLAVTLFTPGYHFTGAYPHEPVLQTGNLTCELVMNFNYQMRMAE